jgi:hypothetical protein
MLHRIGLQRSTSLYHADKLFFWQAAKCKDPGQCRTQKGPASGVKRGLRSDHQLNWAGGGEW